MPTTSLKIDVELHIPIFGAPAMDLCETVSWPLYGVVIFLPRLDVHADGMHSSDVR